MNQADMKPEEALQNLDGAAACFQGNRQQHEILARSVAILKTIIEQWHQQQAGDDK